MSPAVFLSYVEDDSGTVLPLARELRRFGHATWTFEEDGVGSSPQLQGVHDAVCACPAFLLVASPASVRSSEVVREVELARSEQRTIVPLLIDLTMEQLRSAHPTFEAVFGATIVSRACSCDSCELATSIHEALDGPVLAASGVGMLAAQHALAGLPTFALSLGEPDYEEMTCLTCGGIGQKCRPCGGTGRLRVIREGPRLDFRDL